MLPALPNPAVGTGGEKDGRKGEVVHRMRRVLCGAVLAVGLGLTGCGSAETAETDRAPIESEEVGSPDQVDGGDEDPDGVDPGTGGIDDDDNTAGDPPGDRVDG